MKAKDVAQYLLDHPEFFNKHTELIADLQIPHLHDDKVISINERQVTSLRDKNQVLQNKLLELISFGEENDLISEKMHRLCIALLNISSMDELLEELKFSLHEDFTIPHVALRLWNLSCDDTAHTEFTTTSEDIRTIASSLTQPYCGDHIADEIKNWFGEEAEHPNSFSMIPLKTTESIGLLVLASPDHERFCSATGTLHLKRLGDLVSASLARYNQVITTAETSQNNRSNERQT